MRRRCIKDRDALPYDPDLPFRQTHRYCLAVREDTEHYPHPPPKMAAQALPDIWQAIPKADDAFAFHQSNPIGEEAFMAVR